MWKQRSRRLAGYICIAAGIAGVLLPIIPGIPLLLAGMALLGQQALLSKWINQARSLWRRHFPRRKSCQERGTM